MTSIASHHVTSFAHKAGAVVASGFAHALRLYGNWCDQGAVDRLWRLDDRLLRDAGLDRSDLEWAAQLPLGINPKDALRSRIHRS
jgi:uncharacterized protein YjiS (DUF1127 family)